MEEVGPTIRGLPTRSAYFGMTYFTVSDDESATRERRGVVKRKESCGHSGGRKQGMGYVTASLQAVVATQ